MDKTRARRRRVSGKLNLLFAAAMAAGAAGCAVDSDDAAALSASCADGSCDLAAQVEAAIDLEDLVCSTDKRVILDAADNNGIVKISACFYVHNSELSDELAPIADAYVSLLDDNGAEVAHLPIPDETKIWLTNGLGGNLWFWNSVWAPEAVTAKMYLRGRVNAQWELIGATDIPGTYEGQTFQVPGDNPDGPTVEPPGHNLSAEEFGGPHYEIR